MQMKFTTLTIMCVLVFTTINAQNLFIKNKDGSTGSFALNNIRKITFVAGNCVVQNKANVTQNFAVNNIRYLMQADISTDAEKTLPVSEFQLKVFPNPTSSVLNIELNSNNSQGTIAIFDCTGKCILTKQTETTQQLTIDLSNISNGVYLCKFSTRQNSKSVIFIKK